jgi:succinate dehydrogenase / fumarate reductase, membrane anchor subunit
MTASTRKMGARPARSYDAVAWVFMRVSGLALIFLALFHFFWMHFTIGVENINFDTIVGRWTGPHALLWRLYDMFLLTFAFTHGINGARQVVEDYVLGRLGRRVIVGILWLIWIVLIGMGAWIIFTFRPGMPSPFFRFG